MEKQLANLAIGKMATIVKIKEPDARQKLHYAHLGLIANQLVQIKYIAPRQKAFLVSVRGVTIAIENIVAQKIIVQEVD